MDQEDILIQNFYIRRSTHDANGLPEESRTINFPMQNCDLTSRFSFGAYEIQNMENRIYMHSNYDPAFIVDEMRKRYHTPEHTSYESCYLTYQPMPVKVEEMKMLGTIRQHAKWFTNDCNQENVSDRIFHRGWGMNFSYHYQTVLIWSMTWKTLLYYYMMRILF